MIDGGLSVQAVLFLALICNNPESAFVTCSELFWKIYVNYSNVILHIGYFTESTSIVW